MLMKQISVYGSTFFQPETPIGSANGKRGFRLDLDSLETVNLRVELESGKVWVVCRLR